jgi:hypothetical protein
MHWLALHEACPNASCSNKPPPYVHSYSIRVRTNNDLKIYELFHFFLHCERSASFSLRACSRCAGPRVHASLRFRRSPAKRNNGNRLARHQARRSTLPRVRPYQGTRQHQRLGRIPSGSRFAASFVLIFRAGVSAKHRGPGRVLGPGSCHLSNNCFALFAFLALTSSSQKANEYLSWFSPFSQVRAGYALCCICAHFPSAHTRTAFVC